MRLPLILLLSAAVGLTACGGTEATQDNGDRSPEQLFAGTCGSCHTLAAAGTDGTFGPNLDELAPDDARVRAAIENGPGAMPNGLLVGEAADAVAAYVAANAGG